ncbi:DUF4157 domain-containing protein [Jatrophihabitans sp. DSM 45814]
MTPQEPQGLQEVEGSSRRPASSGLRRTLQVGASDDPAELAADRVARDVVAKLREPEVSNEGGQATTVGGSDVADAHEYRSVPATAQRSGSGDPGGRAPAQVEKLVSDSRASGRPLPADVRTQFETAMATDLSAVRVHTGAGPSAAGRSISAKAFTVADDIFFTAGMPDTSRPDGQALLAHELAHTVQQRSGSLGSGTIARVWELNDDTDGLVNKERVESPATTVEQLRRWAARLEWDDDDLGPLIASRIEVLEAAASADADRSAIEKSAKAKDEAEAAALAEKAELRREVEAAAGGPLANYDEAVDRLLRQTLKDVSFKAPQLCAQFFLAAALMESGSTAQQVLSTLIVDEVALEAFIYGNGGLGCTAVGTTVAQATKVSKVWDALADSGTLLGELDELCAQIVAGRINPLPNEYRKAKITSNSGLVYRFGRLEKKRPMAEAELHLHVGKKGALNNSGIKNHKQRMSSDRVLLSGSAYSSLYRAIDARGLWKG